MKNKIEKVKKTKDKSEEYVFKKSRWMKAKRAILWTILIYFFVRGIAITFRPDDKAEVTQMITKFRQDFSNYKDQDNEIMSFAQDFVKEYLTYKNKDDEDYKKRIRKYVTDNFYNTSQIMDLNGDAKAIYVQAYKKQEYSPNQYDIYVKAEVNYTIQTVSQDENTFKSKNENQEVILKVPVFVKGKSYVVEDIPMFVNDNERYNGYQAIEYSDTELSDDKVKDQIEKSLNNFFKAYYEQNQSVINYYLTKDADEKNFIGLNGQVLFDQIDSLECYQGEASDYILCIVKLKVKDGVNDDTMYQQFNVVAMKNNNKYYVKDMNTRSVNLNIKSNKEVGKR